MPQRRGGGGIAQGVGTGPRDVKDAFAGKSIGKRLGVRLALVRGEELAG